MRNRASAALRRAIVLGLASSFLSVVPLGCGGNEPGKTTPTEPAKAIEKSNQGMLDHMKSQTKK